MNSTYMSYYTSIFLVLSISNLPEIDINNDLLSACVKIFGLIFYSIFSEWIFNYVFSVTNVNFNFIFCRKIVVIIHFHCVTTWGGLKPIWLPVTLWLGDNPYLSTKRHPYVRKDHNSTVLICLLKGCGETIFIKRLVHATNTLS